MDRDDVVGVIEAWARAVSSGDEAALGRLVAPELGAPVIARTRAIHAAFRDITVEPHSIVVEGTTAAWRFRLRGVHVGAIAGIEPSGGERTIEGVNFQRLHAGVVVEHWTTVELASLARR